MTTNQTIDGVPRVLLAEALEAFGALGMHGYAERVRGLLDAPACKTCNGTRIVSDGAMYCTSGGIPFESGPIECVKDCPDCKPAVQPQGEPVADALSTGFYTTETGGGKYAINIGFRSMADMQAADAQLRELLKSR